jgi:hypothetical protein
VDADQGYEWGKESPYGTDCSGTICYPLICMGYKIRTTADELFKKIFTVPIKDHTDLNSIMAVFYVPRGPWKKMSGQIMPDGTAKHVNPVVGWYVVCDADFHRDRIILKTARNVRISFQNRNKGAKAVWRKIDWEAVEYHSEREDMFYSPDPELLDLIKRKES